MLLTRGYGSLRDLLGRGKETPHFRRAGGECSKSVENRLCGGLILLPPQRGFCREQRRVAFPDAEEEPRPLESTSGLWARDSLSQT